MNPHVDYVIIPRKSNGTYDIFEKNLRNGQLTFHSNHAKKKQAIAERDTLKGKPSQGETMKFMKDLKQQIL